MICDDCVARFQPHRVCALCGVIVCRHDARKQRTDDGVESIVCLEPFDCLKRVARGLRL